MQKHILLYIICCIIAIATLATLCSCGPIKYVPIEKTTYIHDTTTITKTYRDTTIVLKSDTLQNEIDTSKDTTSFLKNDYAESTASLSGGHLYHTLYTYPRPIDVKIPTIEIDRKHFKTEKTSKEVPVKVEIIKYKVPKWCWCLLGVNLLAIALFLLKRRFFR